MTGPFLRWAVISAAVVGLLWACPFDTSLREYLQAPFWMPFAQRPEEGARTSRKRLSAPFAGMRGSEPKDALTRLREVYRLHGGEPDLLQATLAAAQADTTLSPKEREEVQMIDAKIDLFRGSAESPEMLLSARKKFARFLQTAKNPEYRSEARGWIAHTHYLLGEQSAAGKIYLDELKRADSNLSEETLRNSLSMTYRYNGGKKLLEQLGDYFDTAEHAAFAIRLATNPEPDPDRFYDRGAERSESPEPIPYERILKLLEKNAHLLRPARGADTLALLAMRTALRAGDPPAALRLAGNVPAEAAARTEPEFLWMLGAARFLSKDYAGAGAPLLELYQSPKASKAYQSAAAYGLCGVYWKTGNAVEQLRFALLTNPANEYSDGTGGIYDQSIYLAYSGFDRGMILDVEAPVEALQEFAAKYPKSAKIDLVVYSLGVRLARENRYEESAAAFASIRARLRAGRMQKLAELYREIGTAEGKFRFARHLSENSERFYFNDRLWSGYQTYAFRGADDVRFTRAERERQIALDRKLKDDQEELWRAALLFREVVRQEGASALGREAARQAIVCVRRVSYRFGREKEIRAMDIELSRWLRSAGRGKAG